MDGISQVLQRLARAAHSDAGLFVGGGGLFHWQAFPAPWQNAQQRIFPRGHPYWIYRTMHAGKARAVAGIAMYLFSTFSTLSASA